MSYCHVGEKKMWYITEIKFWEYSEDLSYYIKALQSSSPPPMQRIYLFLPIGRGRGRGSIHAEAGCYYITSLIDCNLLTNL